MQDEEGAPERAEDLLHAVRFDVAKEGATHGEGASRDLHLGASLGFDLGKAVSEEVGDVRRIERSTDRSDRSAGLDARSGRQDCRPSQRVADEDARASEVSLHVSRGGPQIVDVRGERGVGEVSLALA